ncbi:MAG: Branched-chain amino acid aminotransferase/4-amino-4-deoxychorismate lyase [Candidatus Alkanophagales archaeon MCA70_species_1]|nr:Branched-chain amino acid aminotransferase/4-amino-4-deoxychorismate lyase [Candidatus Alkanophaga volatiphilum]
MAERLPERGKIWMNGKFVDWKDAKVHVLSHALHYGSGVFEGIRCYNTERGSFIFRLKEHVDRLFWSAKLYRIEIPYTAEEIKEAIKETIRVNGLKACYIRPIVFYGYYNLGVHPGDCPVECVIAVWEWGTYLGEEALERGIRCTISPWRRLNPTAVPVTAKAVGHYVNSMLAVMDARSKGFDEALMLDENGYVSEGSGENLFIVRDGVIYTPGLESSILPGITRDSVIKIARDLGFEVVEKPLTVGEVLTADEAFFTGTAAEVTPIREIDFRIIGDGKIGPVTKAIQSKFFDIVNARDEKYMHWLEPVYE